MFREKVKSLLEKALAEDESLFLIDFEITPSNTIYVVLDGDKGVSLQDCIKISRAIEHNLDREETDFSLEVTSAGATSAIVLPRQYKKNIGRILNVNTLTDNFEGTITNADENEIILEWKTREPKPIGKGKITVKKQESIAYNDITKAVVVIKF